MEPRRGRPRRLDEEKSDKRVVSYFSESEKAALQRLADEHTDGNIAAYIRLRLADDLETA